MINLFVKISNVHEKNYYLKYRAIGTVFELVFPRAKNRAYTFYKPLPVPEWKRNEGTLCLAVGGEKNKCQNVKFIYRLDG